MREFQCDETLVRILEKQGSGRFIKFDFFNFIFWSGLAAGDTIHSTAVSEIELKSIFGYMNYATADKYLITGDVFSVKRSQETYKHLKRGYDFYGFQYPNPGKNLKRVKRLLDS